MSGMKGRMDEEISPANRFRAGGRQADDRESEKTEAQNGDALIRGFFFRDEKETSILFKKS